MEPPSYTPSQLASGIAASYQAIRSGQFSKSKDEFYSIIQKIGNQALLKANQYVTKRYEDKETCPDWFKNEPHPTKASDPPRQNVLYSLLKQPATPPPPIRSLSYFASHVFWLKKDEFIAWGRKHPEVAIILILTIGYFTYTRPIISLLAAGAVSVYHILD